jgi:hypothetical protein
MICIPMWGAHGVQRGASFVMAADSADKRKNGTKQTPQKPKPVVHSGRHPRGGNTRGR